MNNLDLLQVYQFDNKIRLGVNQDGGYVIGNIDTNYDCYISAGVSNEESFTRDFLNLYKVKNSYAFDGTIDSYPVQYNKEIEFIKKNIGSVLNTSVSDLKLYLRTFNNIFIKMDIEGGEYSWIDCLTNKDLSSIKQLAIEFHGINDDSWGCTYLKKMDCLKKLNETHYIIHIHGNNNSGLRNGIPDVIEVTYLNKSYFTTTPPFNVTHFPIKDLDYPNAGTKDYQLLKYPFLSKHITSLTISIGYSEENTKTLRNVLEKGAEYSFILVNCRYDDAFVFTIDGVDLIVKRTDYPGGWGHSHSVIALKA